MGRDIEYDVVTNDHTDRGLHSAEAKFRQSQERIRRENDKTNNLLARGIVQTAGAVSPKLAAQLTNAFGLAGQAGPALLVGGIAAAAPFIGATLSAAVIGGAGVGGVIGGVVLASRDPRVKAAGAQLGATLLGDLEQDARVFVVPLLGQIDRIERRFEQMNGRIRNIFANSAGFLDPLVGGALDGIDGILRGADRLVAKAQPVILSLGDSFDRIGNAVGDAMETIAGGSDEAAAAVTDLASAVVILIEFTGGLVRGLTELYGAIKFLSPVAEAAYNGLTKLIGSEGDAKDAAAAAAPPTDRLADGVGAAGAAAAAAAPQLATFTDKVDGLAGKGRSAFDAVTNLGEATAAASKALEDNGKTLDQNTEKGRANRQALSNLAGALVGNYDAYVKLNGEGSRARKVADDNRAAFITLAQKFGLSRRAAADLASQMGLIPAKKRTDFAANTHDAAGRIKALQDQVDRLHGKNISVRVSVSGTERLNQLGHRIGGYSAAGMSWAAADGTGVSRTGGPSPISLTSTVESRLYLDGSLVYQNTARQVRARADRDAWRQKVGSR
ncbi:MAG TPA: hypothetical protein VFM50_02875 [Nocardioidaceae bacterium]|nr:hypothetical protein [Nocardioidaceae bacterium]